MCSQHHQPIQGRYPDHHSRRISEAGDFPIDAEVQEEDVRHWHRQPCAPEYQQQDKDMQLLSYQILVDKFNEKYGDLSDKQKKVLREYINNVSNTNNLKELISSEVPHIKRTLRNKMRSIKDPVVRIKLKEVAKQATALGKRNVIKDQEVLSLMRFYELIKELKNIK